MIPKLSIDTIIKVELRTVSEKWCWQSGTHLAQICRKFEVLVTLSKGQNEVKVKMKGSMHNHIPSAIHWYHYKSWAPYSFRETVLTKWYPSGTNLQKIWSFLWPWAKVKMRSRSKWKVACTTTFPQISIDTIIQEACRPEELRWACCQWQTSRQWSYLPLQLMDIVKILRQRGF